MRASWLRLLLFACFAWSFLDAVIIVIHGSFATTRSWWTSKGSFFKEIERQAACFGEAVVPFGWSGFPTAEHIAVAGNALAKLILSYPRSERITIIAHSHGGNVVNMASIALFCPVEKMLERLSSRPIRDEIEAAYAALSDLPILTTASFIVPIPTQLYGGFDYTHTLREVPGIKAAIEGYKASKGFVKKNIIDRVIYLGTPVDENLYAPQMDVIGSLINMYSHGDKIQPIIGFYDRRYKGHEHISNIQVLVKTKGNRLPHAPSHSAIHAPYIGRWLLFMPEVLSNANGAMNNFKQFAFGKDGLVLFDEATGPRFFPQPEGKRYLQALGDALRHTEINLAEPDLPIAKIAGTTIIENMSGLDTIAPAA